VSRPDAGRDAAATGSAAAGPVRLEAVVTGRVQGVGFRWFAADAARSLGVRGWVANEPVGSVRCVAEGSPEALRAFVAALSAGPPGADVAQVRTRWGPPAGTFGSFEIRSSAHRGD